MNIFRRPEPVPTPVLVERPPLTDAEIERLLAAPDFVADYIVWRNAR